MPNSSKPALPELSQRPRPTVPPFARYEGTSAWRKDRRRVRAYKWFKAAEKQRNEQQAQ